MSGAHSPRQKANKGVLGAAGLAPVVTITSPTGNYRVYRAGSPLLAGVPSAATAVDDVDGNVAGSLQWVSDKDGVVGSGASPTLILTTPGQHVITATATASTRQQASTGAGDDCNFSSVHLVLV